MNNTFLNEKFETVNKKNNTAIISVLEPVKRIETKNNIINKFVNLCLFNLYFKTKMPKNKIVDVFVELLPK